MWQRRQRFFSCITRAKVAVWSPGNGPNWGLCVHLWHWQTRHLAGPVTRTALVKVSPPGFHSCPLSLLAWRLYYLTGQWQELLPTEHFILLRFFFFCYRTAHNYISIHKFCATRKNISQYIQKNRKMWYFLCNVWQNVNIKINKLSETKTETTITRGVRKKNKKMSWIWMFWESPSLHPSWTWWCINLSNSSGKVEFY